MLNLLIVDDDPHNRQLFSFALKDVTIHEVASGEDALNAFAQQDFDLAMVDIELPDISGIEVVRRVRAEHNTTLIAMITATDSAAMLHDCCVAGANIYIIKPFELKEIINFIQKLHEHKQPAGMVIMGGRLPRRTYQCD